MWSSLFLHLDILFWDFLSKNDLLDGVIVLVIFFFRIIILFLFYDTLFCNSSRQKSCRTGLIHDPSLHFKAVQSFTVTDYLEKCSHIPKQGCCNTFEICNRCIFLYADDKLFFEFSGFVKSYSEAEHISIDAPLLTELCSFYPVWKLFPHESHFQNSCQYWWFCGRLLMIQYSVVFKNWSKYLSNSKFKSIDSHMLRSAWTTKQFCNW